jgi:glutamate/tyrosine decarboxylase-like PLP-dependent enzyme
VATAGTTNAGMIDPLVACASIARENRLWYHVDAAWGGALIAFDGMRSVLSGIERADSVTIDAHK